MTDTRPASCRERLREEGKAYPKSSCTACGANLATGLKCKHVAVDIESRDKEGKPQIVIDLAGAMDKLTPQMIEAMAPILRDPMVMALEGQIAELSGQLERVNVRAQLLDAVIARLKDEAAEKREEHEALEAQVRRLKDALRMSDDVTSALRQENAALQEALDRVRIAIGMQPGIAGAPGDIAAEVEKKGGAL